MALVFLVILIFAKIWQEPVKSVLYFDSDVHSGNENLRKLLDLTLQHLSNNLQTRIEKNVATPTYPYVLFTSDIPFFRHYQHAITVLCYESNFSLKELLKYRCSDEKCIFGAFCTRRFAEAKRRTPPKKLGGLALVTVTALSLRRPFMSGIWGIEGALPLWLTIWV